MTPKAKDLMLGSGRRYRWMIAQSWHLDEGPDVIFADSD